MDSICATAAGQSFPDVILYRFMELLAPDNQCRMSLANKALRRYFASSEFKAALDRALKLRDEVNGALISDSWQWRLAFRRHREGSFTQYGQPTSSLVMTDKVQCAPEGTWIIHSYSHTQWRSRCHVPTECILMVDRASCMDTSLKPFTGPLRPRSAMSAWHTPAPEKLQDFCG